MDKPSGGGAEGDEFIVFGQPRIEEPEIAEVVDSLRSGWLGTGPKVRRFEREFCEYKRGKYAVAVNSCTAAIHLSLIAAGIGPGDEVITTALTFCATVNAIIHTGATPVLVDVEPGTMNMDCEMVEAAITPRTKVIVPVHFAGRPCNMDRLTSIASRWNLIIVEDCAHAVETEWRGIPVGTFGAFGCFSFYSTKNMTTGEGGMILTDTPARDARLKTMALHGMSADAWRRFSDSGYKHYEVIECGFKYNMMDLQAAIGIHQLRRIKDNWRARQSCWSIYNDLLSDLPLTLPQNPEPDTQHAYHLYTILVDRERAGIDRDSFLDAMTAEGIGVGVHYRSVPEHPYYQKTFGWKPESFPIAAKIGRETVSIPLSPTLGEDRIHRIAGAVRRILKA